MAAPANGIADPVHVTEKHKGCQRDVNAKQHREHIGEAAAGVRPKPVGRRKLDCHPDASKDEKIFPRSRRFLLCGGGERQRNENKAGDRSGTHERESICPQAVNQVDKEHGGAEQVAAAGAEVRGEVILDAARGKKQHHQKEKRESRERGSGRAATVAQPYRE